MKNQKVFFGTDKLTTIVEEGTTLVWLRRDLRLADNAALYYALRENKNVLPVFIFDTVILDHLEDKADKRVDFIHQTLVQLKSDLETSGSSLLVLYGDPVAIYKTLKPKAVYTATDYETYATARDREVAHSLQAGGVIFKTFKDVVIFEKDEVMKDDGKPYTIFTPYSRKWKAKLNDFFAKSYPSEKYFKNLKKINPLAIPSLKEVGFEKTDAEFPERVIHKGIIKTYDKTRNFPAVRGTSRLSLHLRFGTVSIRSLVRIALKTNQVWLNELIWRDFYHMILWNFPQVEKHAFKSAYDQIQWRNNPEEFAAWCEGRTGYPMVDAGMRELNSTGFMHNRVRMVVASFLTKHLLIDWRWGEAYFAKKLLDYDLAPNNGGWQWAAGSGCDAAPYFRVFNPQLQLEKFDPELKYVLQWVPEFGSPLYPTPIVDHVFARERVLKTYKKALDKQVGSYENISPSSNAISAH